MSKFENKFGKDFLSTVPKAPGVYFFYGPEKQLLYIGKAKLLHKRLAQYRNAKRTKRHRKMQLLVKVAVKIEWQTCESELDASLKEAQLIQTHRPPHNVAGAYSFLYPLVGIRTSSKHLFFCLTTVVDRFPQYTFHGCFRSRKITGEAFFALRDLLAYLGHPASAKELSAEPQAEYSYVFGFRQLDPKWAIGWGSFFKGDSKEVLEDLILSLLDRASARKDAERIQKSIKFLKTFFRMEAKPLANALKKCSSASYPVPQLERDPLFLNARAKAEKKF